MERWKVTTKLQERHGSEAGADVVRMSCKSTCILKITGLQMKMVWFTIVFKRVDSFL